MEAQARIALDRLLRALDTELCKALSEPARVEIVKVLLMQGPSDVSDVAKHLSQDRSVVSRHLKTLLQAGLVRYEKQGRNRVYALEAPFLFRHFEELARSMRGAIEACCPPETFEACCSPTAVMPATATVQIR